MNGKVAACVTCFALLLVYENGRFESFHHGNMKMDIPPHTHVPTSLEQVPAVTKDVMMIVTGSPSMGIDLNQFPRW